MAEEKELSFEEAIGKLEEIVTKLEEDNVSLEKAIDYYQVGMKLSKQCANILQQSEEKMAKLLNEDDELDPFHIQGE
ncbi:MAG TPA: exodeoxyribonuclease VII small subunit [Pseudogracilibacillus sp.]|nr:exodeoxyribonuclease VII small subunit [Pseudogracilibacillus sp.]